MVTFESPVESIARAGGEFEGSPVSVPEAATKFEWHHLIPQALKEAVETVKQAIREGFDFDGEENLSPQEKFSKASGKGVHGNHPKYNNAIKTQIENATKANPGALAADILRAVAANARETMAKNPATKMNDLFNMFLVAPKSPARPLIFVGHLQKVGTLPDAKPSPAPALQPVPVPKPPRPQPKPKGPKESMSSYMD